MHPDPAFAMTSAAAQTFARDVAFAHVFVSGPAGIAVIHAPVIVTAAGDLHLHVSRRNRAVPMLAGARALASFGGTGAYVSPDWYVAEGQVPTWNYVAVEAEGTVEPLDEAALVAQVDAVGDDHEARLSPKPAWTRDKMPDGRFDAMLRAIAGYAIRVEAWRGTAKLSQNKPPADVRGVIAGLIGAGSTPCADLVQRANGARL